ncbi:uncharacterized protein EDB93DRAFT_1168616 [Suillus bovinus]|uniref:uncharacterized protein n=1 Tax=Suillus bovinus TaxID=48563 RepID=UPI001B876F25|nr:uncharacterized protein EDB93DRAFT_1168616 [Suillus bovinus]KAG2136611.1 hypothetical protein EDB93DRAFT_1168616 [Suillus bovinus]
MVPDETGDRRFRELTRARQIYVPELILRQHIMLYASQENLKRALELANIVADSTYKLCDDFLHLDRQRLGLFYHLLHRLWLVPILFTRLAATQLRQAYIHAGQSNMSESSFQVSI